MKRAVFLVSLALAGCNDTGSRRGADGYVFGESTLTQTDVRVRFVVHDNLRDLQAALPAGHLEGGTEAKAHGRISAGRCEIHIVDPRKDYAPEWIGHEVTHCIYGNWHD